MPEKKQGKETAGNTGTADPVSEAITQGLAERKISVMWIVVQQDFVSQFMTQPA